MQLQAIARLQKIPDGVAGVAETLKIMRGLVRRYKKELIIRRCAMDLVQNNGQKAYTEEVRDLFTFVRDNIRYLKDIADVETVAAPDFTLETRQGDCDDKAVLLASLLESIGHRARFVALSFSPGIYSHVIVETKIGRYWVPLETTEPVPMGWYPPGVLDRMVVHIKGARE